MYDIHTTRDGATQLICQMTDSHLLNTIGLYCKKVQSAISIIKDPTDDPLLTVFQPQYSKPALTEQAAKSLIFHHNRLQAYVMEATLRGLNCSKMLQAAYGRSGVFAGYSLALPQGQTLDDALSLDFDFSDFVDRDDDDLTQWPDA